MSSNEADSTCVAAEGGLRQRKKDQTRTRVREAAIAVALRDGCSAATVEAITREADVAARTFFNYFESKDHALVGIEPRHIEAAADLARQIATRDEPLGIAQQVVSFLVDVLARAIEARPSPHGRLEVLRQNPHLFEWQIRELDRAGSELRTVVKIAVSPRAPETVDDDVAEQLLLTCLSAVAATGRAWLRAHRMAPPAELVREATGRVHAASRLLIAA